MENNLNLELMHYIHHEMDRKFNPKDKYVCWAGILTNWAVYKDPLQNKIMSEDSIDGNRMCDHLFEEHEFFAEIERMMRDCVENAYFTINSFFCPRKLTRNVRHLNAIVLDYDFYKIEEYADLTAEVMYDKHIKNTLPMQPTAVINSGRGLYVLYCFHHASHKMKKLYNAIWKELYKSQKKFGMDPKAMAATQVIRIPGTWNPKSMSEVYTMEFNRTEYQLTDLASILPYTYEETRAFKDAKKAEWRSQKAQKKSKRKIRYIKGLPYTVNAINSDFHKLVSLRNGDMRGFREYIIFALREKCNFYCVPTDKEIELAMELNKKFKEPLSDHAVIDQTRPARRYPFTTSKTKIVENLEISQDEAECLDYLSIEHCYDHNKARRNKRRNIYNRTRKKEDMFQRRTWIVEQIIKQTSMKEILIQFMEKFKVGKDTFKRDLTYISLHIHQWKNLSLWFLKQFLEAKENMLATFSFISTESYYHVKRVNDS